MTEPQRPIDVIVETQYLEDQSRPEQDYHVFAYTITIVNRGDEPARLLNRHWIIADANGKLQEVRGAGVVGEHPYLKPGEQFTYTSGTMIETPVGSMKGEYEFERDDGSRFEVPIDEFILSVPRVLH